jgi:hypothetical protein
MSRSCGETWSSASQREARHAAPALSLPLIAKHGANDARKHAFRELRNARRARSRMRFTFWAAVVAEIDTHCPTGLSRVGLEDGYVEALRETSTSMGVNCRCDPTLA